MYLIKMMVDWYFRDVKQGDGMFRVFWSCASAVCVQTRTRRASAGLCGSGSEVWSIRDRRYSAVADCPSAKTSNFGKRMSKETLNRTQRSSEYNRWLTVVTGNRHNHFQDDNRSCKYIPSTNKHIQMLFGEWQKNSDFYWIIIRRPGKSLIRRRNISL